MNRTINRTRVILKVNLRLFELNTTGTDTLSAEMKTFYDRTLIETAEPNLVHDQAAQTRNIPKNGGKKIEFRRYNPLEKALEPLTEGVTPEGQKMSVTTLEAEVKQYGGYISLSDLLILTAIDKNIQEATKMIGSQAGRTLDTISREVMNTGTNVIFGDGTVTARNQITANMKLTVDMVKRAVRALKVQHAEKINGHYLGIIHQDCAYDLTSDKERFIDVIKYKNPERIYNGEIGTLEDVRFVETSEAKKFVSAGADGIDVYSTLIIGENAYATTKVEGGGLETIIKQLGSAGTADPLNQRATVGWKALKVTEILTEQYMIRLETASTFNDHAAN